MVTIDAAKEVKATFNLNQYALDVVIDGDGSGLVTSTFQASAATQIVLSYMITARWSH